MKYYVLLVAIVIVLGFFFYYYQSILPQQVEKTPVYSVNNTSFFQPQIKVKKGNVTLYTAKSTLRDYHSSACPKNYPNRCLNNCYQECKLGFFYCYPNGTAVCRSYEGNSAKLYSKLSKIFKGNFVCSDNINPGVAEKTALSILPHVGSNEFPYLLYIINLYNWTRNNIRYIPGYSNPKPVEEVLTLKAGKCDEQAYLLASMVASIGGVVRVRLVPPCQHAWAEVFIPTKDVEEVVDEIDYYTGAKEIEYFKDYDGIWLPVDTTGANQMGKILDTCLPWLNDSVEYYYCKSPCSENYFYFNNSCYSSCPGGTGLSKENPYKCLPCPENFPYTYNNTCVNTCPNGTGLASDGKSCTPCPKGYQTYNNTCVTCPAGYYLGIDGKCYPG